MSKFLGPIHFWLYNKIQIQEIILDGIYTCASKKGFNSENLYILAEKKFGESVVGELEDVITQDNIHGWLQERISSCESRLAFSVTTLLKENVLTLDEIINVFQENALECANKTDEKGRNASEIYSQVYNNLLAGMPCDNVNAVTEKSETKISWVKTIDIHKDYWDKVDGDVSNFDLAIDKWIETFVKAINPEFSYKVLGETFTIERV